MNAPIPTRPGSYVVSSLADVWQLMETPLMKAVAGHEPPLPALEPVDISIRPLNPNAWPKGTFDEEL